MKWEGKIESRGFAIQGGYRSTPLRHYDALIPGMAAIRLAVAAAETGARFVRERIAIEPIEWLLGPRDLFGGRMAIEACQGPEGFRRALALHGLSLGFDADPAAVAKPAASEFLSEAASRCLGISPPYNRRNPDRGEHGDPALYSCTISSELEDVHIHVFAAMIARSAAEVRGRLRHRFGPLLEDEALIHLGFDWSEPLACAMVSEAMAHLLMLAAEDPTSPLAEGLDFQIEQRFAS